MAQIVRKAGAQGVLSLWIAVVPDAPGVIFQYGWETCVHRQQRA